MHQGIMSSVSNIVFEELKSLGERIASNIVSTGQNASGNTVKSIKPEETETGAILYGRNYFGVLETGRKPGKGPYRFQDVIYQWSIDKGIAFRTASERKSFAWVVSKKIQEEGTLLFRKGGRSDVYSKEIKEAVEAIRKRITSIMKQEVESIKLNV